MARPPLEERIRKSFDGLSPSHRRLAEYLLRQESAAAFSTARQLARDLGISESTVVRLAPALGYTGFQSLQSECRGRLLSRMAWQPSIRRAIDSLPGDPPGVLRQVLQHDIESIRNTLASLRPDLFQRAVEAIRGARNVYFIGLRSSAPHALYGTMRLRLVHPRTRLLSPHVGDLADQMLAFERGDLLIALSYYRYAVDTVRALRFARERSVRTVVITDSPVSPPAKAAEIVLVAQGLSGKLAHSLVAPLSVLNALITAAAVLQKASARRNIARAYHAVDEFGLLLAPASPTGNGTTRVR